METAFMYWQESALWVVASKGNIKPLPPPVTQPTPHLLQLRRCSHNGALLLYGNSSINCTFSEAWRTGGPVNVKKPNVFVVTCFVSRGPLLLRRAKDSSEARENLDVRLQWAWEESVVSKATHRTLISESEFLLRRMNMKNSCLRREC